jgi:hypothetical protein
MQQSIATLPPEFVPPIVMMQLEVPVSGFEIAILTSFGL